MRTALIALALLGLAGLALAGETPEQKKAERVAEVTREIKKAEASVARWTPEAIEAKRKSGATAAMMGSVERGLAKAKADLPALKLELSWLQGEITLTTAEVAVKAAQDALDKADEKGKPEAQAKLDAAKSTLEAVRKLEDAKEF